MDRITGNIMIIDDIPENLDLLENMLISQNFEVRPFPQGEMAFKKQPRLIPPTSFYSIL